MGRVTAILNPKGGVGKTTSAVNLAAGLAEAGHRVLLVDLDDQLYATKWCGAAPSDGLLDAMTSDVQLEPVGTTIPGVDLLPAASGLSTLSLRVLQDLELRTRQHTLLAEALEQVQQVYDDILLDCPGDLDDVTINALFAADQIIVAIRTAYLSYSSLGDTMEKLARLARAQRRDVPTRILMGMHQRSKRVHLEVVAAVQEEFPQSCFETIIPFNVKLEEAASYEKSILEYDPRGVAAEAFRHLAKEVIAWA